MGKVYEALLRAETEDAARDIDEADEMEAIEVEDERAINNSYAFDHDGAHDTAMDGDFEFDQDFEPAQTQKNSPVRRSSSSRFSFLRYSLGDGSIFDKGPRQATATSASALTRRSVAQPTREATLDFSRIDPHLSAFFGNDRQAGEQFNKLALTLISRAAQRGFKRVLVTSANHGEGRTSVTLNLACALARARQRVLVVDCDLLRPAALERLGLSAEIGLAEAFKEKLAPGAATLRIQPFGFNLLPCRKRVENPVEFLAAPGFWRMLQQFDADHDFILFDSPPLLEMGDVSLLAKFTDTTLMVVESGAITTTDMAKAIAPFAPEDLLGVVLNRIKK